MKIRARLKDGVDCEGLPGGVQPGDWVSGEYDPDEDMIVFWDLGSRHIALVSARSYFDAFVFMRRRLGEQRRSRLVRGRVMTYEALRNGIG